MGTAGSVARKHLQKWLKTKAGLVVRAHGGAYVLLSASDERGSTRGTKIARKGAFSIIFSCPSATGLEMKLYLMLVPKAEM